MKLIVILCLILGLAACGDGNNTAPTTRVEINSTPISRPNLVLPRVDGYSAHNIEWIIITPDNADEVFATLAANGDSVALFAVTSKGYEKLSINAREALRVIMQQQSTINGYKRYYIEVDGVIFEYNQSLNK